MGVTVRYSIVVPAFNEEAVIKETHRRLKQVMDSTRESYELLFVNDGSRDRTLEILKGISKEDPNVRIIGFSRNFGHQVAITAGMDHASGQAIVCIDADLQDPPDVILEMIAKWKEGYDVVYGKRMKRKGETFFKKLTASVFYRFLRNMTTVNIPVDAGDFRLLDRKVCDVLKQLPEKNRYIRGLVSWIGFRQTYVEYVREERFAGETKYPLKKMLRFAWDGITSFSRVPLIISTGIGMVLSIISTVTFLAILVRQVVGIQPYPWWVYLILLNLLCLGFVFIVLGIMGEYIGRIYDETKNRPLYIVSEKAGFHNEQEPNELHR